MYRGNPSLADFARAAAYIDGEGCISIKRRVDSTGHSLLVTVTNSDPRIVCWFRSVFGGAVRPVSDDKSGRRTKPCYTWTASTKLAHSILTECIQFLISKRDQADIALCLAKTGTWRGKHCGIPLHVVKRREELKQMLHDEKRKVIPLSLVA